MKTLTMALFAEGTTDDRFLKFIIARTARHLLLNRGVSDVDVWDPTPLQKSKLDGDTLEEQILSAAKSVHGYHILFVHQDADARTTKTCFEDRILPGLQRIEMEQGEVCRNIVPVIPVRNIEAWLMADTNTLLKTVGTNLTPKDLNLSDTPAEVERLSDPKATFKNVITEISSKRRRGNINHGIYYEKLAQVIRIEALLRVPAFVEFAEFLDQALQMENFY